MTTPAEAAAPEITPLELARALEGTDPVQVLDVRAPARVAAGRVDTPPAHRFHNLVGSRVRAHRSLDGMGLDPAMPIAVVCGHGNDSRVVASHLNGLGARARSLRGGMAAWMTLVLPRELPAAAALDRVIQFDRIGKGALGYALVSDGEALLIDPPRDASAYLAAVTAAGARVVGVADTHVHADYISGAPGLARALGVPYHLHPADMVYPYDGTPGRIPFDAVTDGSAIALGRATVRARHTPGHTEGSVTYLVDGAAFTGDFLFVGSVGRPDLAGKTREWTPRLWESLAAARAEWPLTTTIWPAHYASESERRPDRSVGASLGEVLVGNPALQIPDRRAFIEWVERRTAPFPEAYRSIKAVNVGLHVADDREAEDLEVGRNECALAEVR
jgi:glyoxylase-like metal-dependent hydrolase (beta-lactamase superfamily II)